MLYNIARGGIMKRLGFVIVNYNDFENTSILVNNIKNYNVLEKIVIVDNKSLDDSYSKLKSLENDKIVVLKNDSNHLSSGWTIGAKYLNDNIGSCNIILSNTDIIINSEKDLIMLNNDISEKIVVVAPVINEHGVIKKAWPISTPCKEILFNLPLLNRFFKSKFMRYPNKYYDKDISVVGVVSGCFFLCDGDVLKSVDYFDTATRIYYEENILACKIRDINKLIAIDNRVEIIHNHSVTIDKSINKINKYKLLKESQKYYVKNYIENLLKTELVTLDEALYIGKKVQEVQEKREEHQRCYNIV